MKARRTPRTRRAPSCAGGCSSGRRRQLAAGEEPPPHPVYAQHSLLRAYALALLRRAEEETAPGGRHADHYQALAGEDWRAGERFWEQVEHAWGWAWGAGPERALAYYYGLRRFLELRGRGANPHRVGIAPCSSLPDEEAVEDRERATLLNNIGSVYDALGDKQRALEFYDQALPLRRQVGDRAGEATTLNNIGACTTPWATSSARSSSTTRPCPSSDRSATAAARRPPSTTSARVYDALGDKQRALEFYDQALPLSRQVGDRSGEATTLNNIGARVRRPGRQAARARVLRPGPAPQPTGRRPRRRGDHAQQHRRACTTPWAKSSARWSSTTRPCPSSDRSGTAAARRPRSTTSARVYSALGEQAARAGILRPGPAPPPTGRRPGRRGDHAQQHRRRVRRPGRKAARAGVLRAALPLLRQVGDRGGEATTLNNIGSRVLGTGRKAARCSSTTIRPCPSFDRSATAGANISFV